MVRPVPPDEQRQDFAALRQRGILLTPSIRRLLWVAIDLHDVTRDAWAAKIIRSVKPGTEVEAVKAALHEHIATATEKARLQEGYARAYQRRAKADARAVMGRLG